MVYKKETVPNEAQLARLRAKFNGEPVPEEEPEPTPPPKEEEKEANENGEKVSPAKRKTNTRKRKFEPIQPPVDLVVLNEIPRDTASIAQIQEELKAQKKQRTANTSSNVPSL